MAAVSIPDLDRLPLSAVLTEPEMALAINFGRRTIQQWRLTGDPRCPPHIMIGTHARYSVGAAREYLGLPPRGARAE